MTLVHRWPNGQPDVVPTMFANVGPTERLRLAQRWANGGVLSGHGQFLDELLRDRIVCGIADYRIQCRLLSESDLTLQKALEISLAIYMNLVLSVVLTDRHLPLM